MLDTADEWDIAVVGAGPAGLRFAGIMGENFNVIVLEENREIGKPVQCSGLVSPRVINASGLPHWYNEIRSVDFYSPAGSLLALRGEEVKGYVIDRTSLDRHLAAAAARKGAEIMTGASFISAERCRDGIEIRYRKNGDDLRMKVKLLIGADGVSSSVSRTFGMYGFSEIISCLQCDAYVPELNEGDAVRLYFGENVAPGFFAWAIPAREFTRIGLGIRPSGSSASLYFSRLLERLNVKSPLNLTGGPIPIGKRGHIVQDRVMLIGDAAGQVKPISGGGIYTGMAAAAEAAETARECLESGDLSARALMAYEKKWSRGIGREISRAALVRKIFLSMTDARLDDLFKTLMRSHVRELLAEGDIDFPTRLSPLVLSRAPELWRFSPSLISALL